MNTIYKYLKDYKKESILGPLFKLLEASFELVVPLIIAAIIDNGIPSGNTGYIGSMCALLALLAVVGFACSVTAQYFSAKAACGFGTKLRHALFAKIQSLSFTELDTVGTGTLITRMTGDINQVQSTLNIVLRLFLRSPFIVFGAMIMAFTIDFRSALVFAVTIAVLSAAVFGIMLGSVPLYKKVQSSLDKITTLTSENLEGVRVIRAFCNEESEKEKYDAANSVLNAAQRLAGSVSALLNPVTYIMLNVAVTVLIYVGAVRVDGGAISQGMVVALYNYMSQILVELIKLAGFIINISKSTASMARIDDVLSLTPSVADGTAEDGANSEFAVEMENVSLKYKGAGAPSLEDINLKVKKGETVGIIGSTGCGKSSLVNLIPRFYDAQSGTVRVDGVDVKQYQIDALRRKTGVVMQKNVLFKGTIRENLLWGNPNATEDDINSAIDAAQARDIINAKPDGVDSEVEQGGTNFSGGQRQRLTIARALVRKPEILILDDSSSALDYATDARLRGAIKNLGYKTTVFIVSQRTASIRHADKIVVLDDGKICGIGTHDSLLESCPVYREIHMSQQ